MGANGSKSSGYLEKDEYRLWKTFCTLNSGIKVIERKDPKISVKLPEESHSPNSIYAIFRRDGNDVKAIAKYDGDCRKVWEIHTAEHENLHEHYHVWKHGCPTGQPKPLTEELRGILNLVRNFN